MYLQTIRGRQSHSAMLTLCIILLRCVQLVCGEECPLGWYGGRCQHECPERCASVLDTDDVHCDKLSGSCSSGCLAGWYGDRCNSQCSTHCVNMTCNQRNGHCTLGCPHNREGHFCETLKVTEAPPAGTSTTTESPAAGPAVIVVPVCVAVVVVAAIIIVVILYRRRKRQPKRILNTRTSPEEGMLLCEDLRHASLVGDVDVVEQILSDKNEDVNCTGEDGRSPVMCAASQGHGDVVTLLVEEGADLSLVDNEGENVLHVACLGGYEDIVKYLLTLDTVDIHSKGCYGRTPVMKAAEKGRREVFELLIGRGGDVSSLDGKGNNILHVACIGGYAEMVKHVLSLGIVGINSRGQYGRTPAMMAAGCRHKQVVEVLKNNGADLSMVDDDGNNILHMACIGGHPEVLKFVLSLNIVDINTKGQHQRTPVRMVDFRKHRTVFNLLVSKGADLSQVDDRGENILHVACLEGHLDLVKEIVTNHRVDVNSRGRYGRTPVMKAAEKGHKDVLGLLKSKGGDVTSTDDNGNNILHVACIGGHVEMVELVISQHMVDIDSRGQYGRTPAMMAAGCQYIEVVQLLVEQGADLSLTDNDSNNILHTACIGGHPEVVKFFLSLNIVNKNNKGADLSQVDDRGENILHVACLEGHLDLVKEIVTNHRVDVNSRGRYGRTPVMKAAEKGHKDVLGLLKSKGGDVTSTDDNGNNILHVACIGGHVEMVKHIVSNKMVDINSRGQYGRTPVLMATGAGHVEVVESLEGGGADITLTDDDSNNILHVACYGGYLNIVKYVISLNIVDIAEENMHGLTSIKISKELKDTSLYRFLMTQSR